MDGVIVDNHEAHKKAFYTFFEKHNLKLSPEEIKNNVFGKTNQAIFSYLFREQNLSTEKLAEYAFEKESIYRNLYKDEIKEVKGFSDFLKFLIQNNIPKSIGTSAPKENVDFTLKSLGLNAQTDFDFILDENDVSHGKPDPEIYLKSAAKHGLKPSECIVVEDSVSGIKAAQNAGAQVAGIVTTLNREEIEAMNVSYIINDFYDLKNIIVQNLELSAVWY